LERILEPMSEGRDWRIVGLDAYGPQMSENVRRLCWNMGYIVIIHGGGATGITQTNDTDLHQGLRKNYTAEEMSAMADEARTNPCPCPKEEACIDWMAHVWSDVHIHEEACKGYKKTGTTNALNGDDDHLICREAKLFWNRLGIKQKRENAIHGVKVEVDAGRLPWSYENVYSIIKPFPARGALDETVEFQDDEVVTLEPGELAWDDDDDDGPRDVGAIVAVVDDDDDDPRDGGALVLRDAEADDSSSESFHEDCDFQDPLDVGDGPRDGGAIHLSAAQADVVSKHSDRISALQTSIGLLTDVGHAAMVVTLQNALHDERRVCMGTAAEDVGVARAMQDDADNEARTAARKRKLMREEQDQKSAAKVRKAEEQEATKRLANIRRQTVAAEELLETQNAVKSYTPQMLGYGNARWAGPGFVKRRREVFNRVAKQFNLQGQARNDWAFFVDAWDSKMVLEHGSEWGKVFAEMMQKLMLELEAGDSGALVAFQRSETRRVLGETPMLIV
jgi:hypothetical protein